MELYKFDKRAENFELFRKNLTQLYMFFGIQNTSVSLAENFLMCKDAFEIELLGK